MPQAPILTDRQRRFIEAFLDVSEAGGRLCAAKAARIAGYAWPRQQGARLMSFPHVHAEVERRFLESLVVAARATPDRLRRRR